MMESNKPDARDGLQPRVIRSVRARPNNPLNSFGIRIAQPLLDVTGLSDEVEIVSLSGLLTITLRSPRGRLGRSGSSLRRAWSDR